MLILSIVKSESLSMPKDEKLQHTTKVNSEQQLISIYGRCKGFIHIQDDYVKMTCADTKRLVDAVNYMSSVEIFTGICEFIKWFNK